MDSKGTTQPNFALQQQKQLTIIADFNEVREKLRLEISESIKMCEKFMQCFDRETREICSWAKTPDYVGGKAPDEEETPHLLDTIWRQKVVKDAQTWHSCRGVSNMNALFDTMPRSILDGRLAMQEMIQRVQVESGGNDRDGKLKHLIRAAKEAMSLVDEMVPYAGRCPYQRSACKDIIADLENLATHLISMESLVSHLPKPSVLQNNYDHRGRILILLVDRRDYGNP
ncbi:hypothetical protein QBC46DRAFT_28331 [Diplogelasinospora grovesii]|uniref:Uncharacterized protein n=1 Tax=Diplogelasinospora grovesii TaxID=303347 RepID=A0AAN6NHB7_9PEZI|nr:hypothetical protein QBC46DRAFT_28331 [Diplogelasinospora grovesii]